MIFLGKKLNYINIYNNIIYIKRNFLNKNLHGIFFGYTLAHIFMLFGRKSSLHRNIHGGGVWHRLPTLCGRAVW